MPHKDHSVLPLERQISTPVGKKNEYCMNNMEHINTLCGQNAEILLFNLVVHTLNSTLHRVELIELTL